MQNSTRATALAAVMMLAVTACGDDDDGDAATGDGPLSGVEITVGSKEFPESRFLGQVAITVLEDAGATVNDEVGIQGTANTRSALESGDIDMYWEYTGTAWVTIFGREVADAPTDPQTLWEEVRDLDAENGVVWLEPSEVNNTYAIASAPGVASGLGVETLSDYAELVQSSPEDAVMCAAEEFLVRDDGLPGMEATYGFEMPESAVEIMELSIIQTRIPESDPCNFGEVFATDGQIVLNDLEVLEDDQNAFPPYNQTLTVRQELYDEIGTELDELFNPIIDVLTVEMLQDFNGRVSAEPDREAEITEEFLQEQGFAD